MWHERTKPAVASGKLSVLGVIQEQHAERCRLFAQWKGFDWPIVQDAINKLGPRGIPIVVMIDELGIVRGINPKLSQYNDFISQPSAADRTSSKKTPSRRHLYATAQRLAATSPSEAATNLQIGDDLFLWGTDKDLDEVVGAYQKVVGAYPNASGDSAASHFRLGVALRRRYESTLRKPNDFQTAVQHWSTALNLDPNQYIWRRRIQQYGPRMNKPYAFYDWIATAQEDIRGRGEEPITVRVELTRAEMAQPAKKDVFVSSSSSDPDPQGKILRDREGLVQIETAIVPPHPQPNTVFRVFLELKPDSRRDVHWTNDAGPTIVWINRADKLQTEDSLWTIDSGQGATSDETRFVEFEARLEDDAPDTLSGFALYFVCEGKTGTCVYRRQDFTVSVAPSKQP